ncbi:GH92 family glycosyl hydrolase [Flavobacteriaceae bacterium]|nr:GH92 family glycosyl hydrolase [Flavobacteriaceae bacterium]MDA9015457.1 GH92 family glycosyl hydrolase [Flavobacteriaceae bacterium]MDC3354768.1 GH92 family glycosyl hydrolase [Flavobacteriaceae bacterium]
MIIKKYSVRFYYLIGILLLHINGLNAQETKLVDFVNPLIGTANSTTESALKFSEKREGNAQVVPFVSAPFGMTQWTPETQSTEQKCIAPYYYNDTHLSGFRASHWISGSCTQDYGSVTLMPTSGDLTLGVEERKSRFFHDKEESTPYSYKVHLEDYNINVSMTASQRSGLFIIDYLDKKDAHLIIHPNSDEGEGYVEIHPEQNEITGYNPAHRIYQGWGEAAGFSGYFVIQYDTAIQDYGVYSDGQRKPKKVSIEKELNSGAYITFDLNQKTKVTVRVGTSFTSIEAARENLKQEIGDQNFKQVSQTLKSEWEALLQKIKVESEDLKFKERFYTAMYHSALLPRIFNDWNGDYIKFASSYDIANKSKGDYYVDFSMWDTFRALHPLFTLWVPERAKYMMESLLLKADQGGWLPIFPAWNNYTAAMIGDHVQATIADAVAKNLISITDKQYALLLQNAFDSPALEIDYIQGKGRRALASYLKYQFIPLEDDVPNSFHKKEQVSRTLEYAYNDFVLYTIALRLGDTLNASKLKKRAMNYKNVFSQQNQSVRGRFKDGSFIEEFEVNTRQSYITEGTPFQYTWFVPHDMNGLIELFGSEDQFTQNLDRFRINGNYWHGNEPGHHIPFLYNFSGSPWKTQQWVRTIAREEYGNGPGGLSGNDDSGQMSAWYVFASLGFYPVSPGVPEYIISGPLFEKIIFELPNQKKLIIQAPETAEGKAYIQEIKWNGKPYPKVYLNHNELLQGGLIEFKMGETPNLNWGVSKKDRPFSLTP